jgi:hypothetical protein
MLKIYVLGWDRQKKCGGIKPVNGSPTFFWIIESSMAIHAYTQRDNILSQK